MSIDWNKIVTNAVSALVTIVFVGAATLVWTKANGIESAIAEATEKLDKTIMVLQDEIIQDRKNLQGLQDQIDILLEQLPRTGGRYTYGVITT